MVAFTTPQTLENPNSGSVICGTILNSRVSIVHLMLIIENNTVNIMDRGRLIAIITGAISILIAIAYLVIVQLLDFRGEMIPAPVSQLIIDSVIQ